jgi:hypothetical protein
MQVKAIFLGPPDYCIFVISKFSEIFEICLNLSLNRLKFTPKASFLNINRSFLGVDKMLLLLSLFHCTMMDRKL